MSANMDRWEGKVAVVSGTNSGIGAAIATQLVDAGLKVVGLSRRKNRGEELAKKLIQRKGQFHPLVVDITKEQEVLSAFDWIKEELGPVHILINNAGVKRSTMLIDGDTSMWKETLDTNILGLCMMTREAVKSMRDNNVDGHIVHMNSLCGHMIPPIIDKNVYCASKYAVTALTETLRQELNTIGSKIKITSISPGFVKTEMLASTYLKEYKTIKEKPALESEDVASAVLYTLSTPPHVQIQDILIRPVGQIC
ncbi:hypothetical protein RN001_013612 [Aquatica leii]|uniref:Farnesol dehydrogenase n=1 Tax=Aquatica leii TaxID=1421715 RepID=A0AAN7PRZ1_9COLE|nr:hypothetical protein RN001_013612 [Aquatica leii]